MIQWIKDLRSTEKGRTLFKLSLYFLFFFIVLLLCVVAGSMKSPQEDLRNSTSSQNSQAEEKKNKTYFDKQKMLIDGDYSFSYEITLGDRAISYVGDKTGDVIEGYKEDTDSLIHYQIENDTTYKIELTKKEEIDDLYKDIDYSLLDFETMFKTLNALSAQVTREDDEKVYSYQDNDKTYKVYVKDEYIEKIDIKIETEEYKLEFIF